MVQEVFRVAASCLDKFPREREGDSFRAWLRGITRNMLLVHFRRASRQPRASGGGDVYAQLEAVADPAATEFPEEDPPSELEALRLRALELVRGQVVEANLRLIRRAIREGWEIPEAKRRALVAHLPDDTQVTILKGEEKTELKGGAGFKDVAAGTPVLVSTDETGKVIGVQVGGRGKKKKN